MFESTMSMDDFVLRVCCGKNSHRTNEKLNAKPQQHEKFLLQNNQTNCIAAAIGGRRTGTGLINRKGFG